MTQQFKAVMIRQNNTDRLYRTDTSVVMLWESTNYGAPSEVVKTLALNGIKADIVDVELTIKK